jgi:hypothetical protein
MQYIIIIMQKKVEILDHRRHIRDNINRLKISQEIFCLFQDEKDKK